MHLGELWSIFDIESALLLARFAARQFLLVALTEHRESAATFTEI
jgi:hypothetical protein